jgi:SAM-dependent methyltransferase
MAVDGSPKFVDQLTALGHPNLVARCSLFEELVCDTKFETVLLAHILEHVDNPVEIIRVGKKHVADGGVILIDVPNADSFHRLAGVRMGLLKKKDDLNETDHKLGHRRVYTVELMKKHIETAELRIREWGGCFLKTVSNAQMEESWTREMMDAYFELGREFPGNAAEIFFVCEK